MAEYFPFNPRNTKQLSIIRQLWNLNRRIFPYFSHNQKKLRGNKGSALFDVKYGELISQRATRSHVHGHRTIYIISVIENGIPRKPISRVRPLV